MTTGSVREDWAHEHHAKWAAQPEVSGPRKTTLPGTGL